MTISSVIALKARALLDFADNNTGNITPQLLRDFLRDFLDTISPAYGIIKLTSQVLNLTNAPVVIAPFVTNHTETATYFSNNLAAGQITRTLGAVQGSRTLIVVSGSVVGPNGRVVNVQVFKNGVALDASISLTTAGGTDPQSFNLAGFDFFLNPPANVVYELRASSPGAVAAFTFTNMAFVVQAQTVRDFV